MRAVVPAAHGATCTRASMCMHISSCPTLSPSFLFPHVPAAKTPHAPLPLPLPVPPLHVHASHATPHTQASAHRARTHVHDAASYASAVMTASSTSRASKLLLATATTSPTAQLTLAATRRELLPTSAEDASCARPRGAGVGSVRELACRAEGGGCRCCHTAGPECPYGQKAKGGARSGVLDGEAGLVRGQGLSAAGSACGRDDMARARPGRRQGARVQQGGMQRWRGACRTAPAPTWAACGGRAAPGCRHARQ